MEFRDRAGNTLDDTAATVLDTAAPTITVFTVVGNGGEPAGHSRDGTVRLTVGNLEQTEWLISALEEIFQS